MAVVKILLSMEVGTQRASCDGCRAWTVFFFPDPFKFRLGWSLWNNLIYLFSRWRELKFLRLFIFSFHKHYTHPLIKWRCLHSPCTLSHCTVFSWKTNSFLLWRMWLFLLGTSICTFFPLAMSFILCFQVTVALHWSLLEQGLLQDLFM